MRFRFPADTCDGHVVTRPARAAASVASLVESGPARLRESAEAGGLRLSVEGELDVATAGSVRGQLARRLAELDPGVPVVLDLRSTTYLASAGVGMVLEARAQAAAAGVPFRVRVQPGSPPDRIIGLAGLADVLTGSASTRNGDDRASAPVTGS